MPSPATRSWCACGIRSLSPAALRRRSNLALRNRRIPHRARPLHTRERAAVSVKADDEAPQKKKIKTLDEPIPETLFCCHAVIGANGCDHHRDTEPPRSERTLQDAERVAAHDEHGERKGGKGSGVDCSFCVRSVSKYAETAIDSRPHACGLESCPRAFLETSTRTLRRVKTAGRQTTKVEH